MEQMKAGDMILHTYYLSSASWRVRAVLCLKNIKYATDNIKLLDGAQHQPEYLKINAMHQVPSLTVVTNDGKKEIITQSLAIIDYLEGQHPTPSVYPKDAILRAKAKAIADTISGGIQPLQNLETLLKVHEPLNREPLNPEEKQRFAAYWITRKLENLEVMVKITAGSYCVGDQVTIADVSLVPQMFNARRFKVDLAKFPTLKAIDERLQKLDIFYHSHPYKCPEAPTDKITPEMENWLEENKK